MKVHCGNAERSGIDRSNSDRSLTAQRKLLMAWIFAGVVPFILQLRSYLKFATPHKITQNLVVPSDVEIETTNLTEMCPVDGWVLSGSWFNIKPTYYFTTRQGRLCHFVCPQYNVHGTYIIGSKDPYPYYTTPQSCANDSLTYQQYFYHGSIGYYSFYEEQIGSYCPHNNNAYIVGQGLGSCDINGPLLAEDRGANTYRFSLWYGVGGGIWIIYRALVLRRCFISCKRHGRMCDELNEGLNRKEAMVFVQENLRLAAHGATNFHRAAVLYLLIESIMTDLFLLIANDGFLAKVQYVSMGYNMSALLVMVFEVIETAKCLREKWRVLIKRLLFSYETTFVGEIFTAGLQQYCLTLLNRSSMKESRQTALSVSYYVWSLVGHGVFVLCIIALVISVRAVWAIFYVLLRHRSLAIFTSPCCLDTVLKLRNKMFLLGGYRCENGKLYYTTSALKAFGLLKMEDEDGSETLVVRKIRWFKVSSDDLFVVATISHHIVRPCEERPCTGILSFCDKKLGGIDDNSRGSHHSFLIRVKHADPPVIDPNGPE
ncbi:hypothetical protein PHMEG_0003628 [Phytophthora megakarya]|uniref:Transmembrane protein n=1 Tax=Phytophthora megakarya TaxID=4795 RepID=A0A225WVW1_9STRA|nr:hypothetical protein PHMEG_0003628 [Phytophthora megakarya]